MTEKELIGKLKELRQIKPNEDWVVLTKARVLGSSTEFSSSYKGKIIASLFPFFRPALVTISAFAILFGTFGFAQNSMPGDVLYSIKKITEKGQSFFVLEQDSTQVSFNLANRRLEELAKVAEANQVKNLAPAINEFQASVSEVTKNLAKIETTTSNQEKISKIVQETKKLEERFRSLGVILENEKLDNDLDAMQGISNKLEVEVLISDLEKMTLTEEQEEVLANMKQLVEKGEYSAALELFSANFEQIAEEPAEKTEVEVEINQDEKEPKEPLAEESAEK